MVGTAGEVDLIGRAVVEGLMQTAAIVGIEVRSERAPQAGRFIDEALPSGGVGSFGTSAAVFRRGRSALCTGCRFRR